MGCGREGIIDGEGYRAILRYTAKEFLDKILGYEGAELANRLPIVIENGKYKEAVLLSYQIFRSLYHGLVWFAMQKKLTECVLPH